MIATRWLGCQRIELAECGSTNDEAGRLARYKADPQRWRFITGPYDEIYRLVEGPFMSSMMREPDRPNGVPNIAHGGYFLLIDGHLHIRGVYDSNDVHRLDALNRDARYLARTQK